MSKYDVAVVGAGPGGSMAAQYAAKRGLRTVFFERGRKAGEKNSSGCGLGARWWRDFPEEFEGVFKLKSCRLIHGDQLNILNKDDRLTTRLFTGVSDADLELHIVNGKKRGLDNAALYRSCLDPYLAELACKAGAELRASTLVTDVMMKNGSICGVVTEKGEKVEADIVIAADGAFSTCAIKSGMRKKWRKEDITLVPQMDFSCSEQKLDDAIGPYHWLWYTCFGGFYQANFRDGFHLGMGQWFHVWNACGMRPVDYFKRMVAAPDFQRMLRSVGAKPREFQSHMLPWMPHPVKSYMNGMMLVGDAAGMPCPLEAEGVWHAAMAGRIAAETAADAISKGDTSEAFLKEYETRWEASHLGREYDFGKEYVGLWLSSVFSPENMVLLSEMLAEINWLNPLTITFDWSDGHMEGFNRHLGHLFDLLPKLSNAGKAMAPYLKGLAKGITPENKQKIAELFKALK